MNKTRHNGIIFEHFFTGERYPRLSEKLTSLRTVGGFFCSICRYFPQQGIHGLNEKGLRFSQKGSTFSSKRL